MKYFIAPILIFASVLQNCKSENGSLDKIQRNTLFYLITPSRSNDSNFLLNGYQTVFANNCKTVSSSAMENLETNSEDSYIVDDMIFKNTENLETRAAFKSGCASLWNGGVVPFEIDPAFSDIGNLYSAFTTWENKTVIRFIKRTSIHKDYIYITLSTGCSSYVGRIGGAQNLNLATSCSYKNMLHELGHAIGFYHEHQRQDRDNFITIYTENVQADKLSNFNKLSPTYSFSAGYDIYSIMHYTPYAFSANSRPTITLKNLSTNFGNTGVLSSLDIENANVLYQNNFIVINNIPVGYYR